uniref:Uncharacterized protein n=1 Tax=Siphoviridae sp. ctKcB20 TaxID=2827568 RepID=A0A8S5LLD2_9CAUD|nr:MAG TPA: hypothetical protein [Siphoviridae sp. ctKcB20]
MLTLLLRINHNLINNNNGVVSATPFYYNSI